MYLARFDSDGEDWVQAVASIEAAAARPPAIVPEYWYEIARQLSAAARIPRATVARRITIDQSHHLRQTITVTGSAEYERRIRETFARLTRIERMQGGSLLLPQQRKDHDAWLENLGSLRFCSTSESDSVHGVPLACDFRVASVLDDLLIDACLGGYELSYQIHMRASEIDPEWLRAARRSMLALDKLPGAPQALKERQEELARALRHAGALCEEYLVVDTPEAVESVASLLADRFHAQYGPLGFAAPAFRFKQGAYEDALVNGVHSHDLEPLSPVDLCSVALSTAERDRLLAWRPSSRLLAQLAAGAADDAEAEENLDSPPITVSDRGLLPEPYLGEGSFAFASYKRQDLYRIGSIINLVRECGVPVWYDRGIPGGAEWDEVIENRVASSRLLLLFTSQAAIDSKYVRREVKFADALDVHVLTILLEDVTLGYGLRMLLAQYQMIDARKPEFRRQLQQAVAYLR